MKYYLLDMFSWNSLFYSVKHLRFELTIFSFFFLHTDRWTLHWWQELYPFRLSISSHSKLCNEHKIKNLFYLHKYACSETPVWYFILFVQRSCVVLSEGLFNWSFLSVVFFLRGSVGTYRMSAERASQLINLHRASMSAAVIVHLRTAVNSQASVTWYTFPLKPVTSQLLKHRV